MDEHPAITRNAELLSADENALVASLKNVSSIYAELLPAIPGAIIEQVKSDCQNNTGATLVKFAEAAGLGLVTSALLARSPVLAKTLLAGVGIGGSALMLGESLKFTGVALGASSPEDQSRLAAAGKTSLARFAADLIETSPGLLLGASSGNMLASRVAALDRFALGVRNVGEYKTRQLVPEGFHYLSLDAKTASGLGANGELNLWQASRQMLAETPWRGIEEGRFFKTAGTDSIKASARIPGTRDWSFMGRPSQQIFHTHENSILPTSGDLTMVRGTGVIGVPQEGTLTFYEGTASQAQRILGIVKSGKSENALEASLSLHSKTFSSLVVDPAKELSLRVDQQWNPTMNRLEPSSVRTLDFGDTVNNLSKWNGRLNIDTIQSSAEALLKPGMTDLMRKMVPNNGI